MISASVMWRKKYNEKIKQRGWSERGKSTLDCTRTRPYVRNHEINSTHAANGPWRRGKKRLSPDRETKRRPRARRLPKLLSPSIIYLFFIFIFTYIYRTFFVSLFSSRPSGTSGSVSRRRLRRDFAQLVLQETPSSYNVCATQPKKNFTRNKRNEVNFFPNKKNANEWKKIERKKSKEMINKLNSRREERRRATRVPTVCKFELRISQPVLSRSEIRVVCFFFFFFCNFYLL